MFKVPHSEAKPVAYALLTIAGFGAVLIAAIMLTRWQMPTVRAITPTLTGQTERCLTCHNGIEAISVAHSIEEFGCVTCHAGNGLAVDETGAHSGLVVNPASLDNAPTYCGECHAAQVLMVERSIMTTYAGAIALIRRAFGAQETGQAEYAARAVGELKLFSPTPEDLQPIHAFAQNCQTCHISAEPQHADYFYRSTGCASCHVLYGETGFYEGGDPAISKTEAGHASTHTFTTAIPYTQCNHCHNRGNYDLRTMTFVPRADIPASEALTGEAKRLHDYYQPISQFTRCEYELDCIDCHNRPTHIYNPPQRSVNHIMDLGWLDRNLPYLKSLAVQVLEHPYTTREKAVDSIRIVIEEYYTSNYPALAAERHESIERAITELQKVYRRNYFPEMKHDWRQYPDHIGHMYSPGCFRCHDGKHVSEDGKVLSRDCNTCHTIVAQQYENE